MQYADAINYAKEEKQQTELALFELREQHDLLMDKMKFFSKDSAVGLVEIEEALTLVKLRKWRVSRGSCEAVRATWPVGAAIKIKEELSPVLGPWAHRPHGRMKATWFDMLNPRVGGGAAHKTTDVTAAENTNYKSRQY